MNTDTYRSHEEPLHEEPRSSADGSDAVRLFKRRAIFRWAFFLALVIVAIVGMLNLAAAAFFADFPQEPLEVRNHWILLVNVYGALFLLGGVGAIGVFSQYSLARAAPADKS